MIETLIGAAVELIQTTDGEPPARNEAHIREEASTVPHRWRAFAKCVLRRETGAVLGNKQSRESARNSSSGAAGRWQYLTDWQHGGAYMIRDRLVQFGMPKDEAKRIRIFLSHRPIHQWPGELQDVLFNEVIERGGWRHWSLGGSSCNALVP